MNRLAGWRAEKSTDIFRLIFLPSGVHGPNAAKYGMGLSEPSSRSRRGDEATECRR